MINGEIFLDFRENFCKKQMENVKLNGEDQPAIRACCVRPRMDKKPFDNWQPCTIHNCMFFNKYEVKDIATKEKLEAFEDADEIERELLRQGEILINDIEGSDEE